MAEQTKQQAIVDNLIRNGFDFLEKAIGELDDSPKYSLIHFCMGVEVLLKARLADVSWEHIVFVDLKNYTIGDLESGKLKTIGFNSLIPKIKEYTEDKITKSQKNNFEKLAQHRNKIVHFHHAAFTSNSEEEKEKIVIEQCLAWYDLKQILINWSFGNDFVSYESYV